MLLPALRPPLLPSPLRRAFTKFGGLGSAFNPAAQFAPNLAGLWYDPSDYASLSQDSAGTAPVTAVGQPVGRMLDKSGRGNHITQATAASRPVTGTQGAIQYLTFDGLDDGMATGAITLTADMDCFIAVRRNSVAAFVAFSGQSGSSIFVGLAESGGTAAAVGGGGIAVSGLAVNGVAVPGGSATTRGQLHTAIPVSQWLVFEAQNCTLGVITALGIGSFLSAAGYNLNGDIGGVILCPAGDAAARQKNRQFLGNKVGLVLP